MLFSARPSEFEKAALEDLRRCADQVLGRAGTYKTSLGTHLGDPDTRQLVAVVAQRFFASGLPGFFAERYGRTPLLNLTFTTVRLQRPEHPDERAGWHMDLNFVNDSKPFLVAWTPLEEIGPTRIGLEVCVPDRSVDLKPLMDTWLTRARAGGQALTYEDADVEAAFGSGRYQTRALRMSAGDSVVFDQYVLHRTQVLPSATESRRSFEFRMADPEALPAPWRRLDTYYCRTSDAARDGIEFLKQPRNGTLRPIRDADYEALDGSAGP